MSLNYKKSKLVESMGYNQVLPTFYGKSQQNIKLTELQFKRLVEGYMDDEDKELAEMNFGDEEGDNLPAGVNFDTEDLNEDDLCEGCGEDLNEDDLCEGCGEDLNETSRDKEGEYVGTPSQVEKRDTYDGRPGRVVGVYSNIKKQREMKEDSGAEESYHDDENIHHDVVDLHRLEKDGASEEHIHDLLDDIHDDEKHGVGKDDKWRDLAGSDFYHDKGMGESVNLNVHLNSLKEYVKKR